MLRLRRPWGHLPALAVCGALVVGLSFWASGKELAAVSRPINALLKERVGNFTDSPRPTLFRSGLLIAAESPVFGLGYESYARHYPVLLATSAAWLGRYGDKNAEVFETSHNMYIQLVSGLVAGGPGPVAGPGRPGRAPVVAKRPDTAASLDLALLLSLAASKSMRFSRRCSTCRRGVVPAGPAPGRAMALEGRARPGRLARLAGGWPGRWPLAGLAAYAPISACPAPGRTCPGQWRAGEVTYEGFYPPEMMDGRAMRWSAGNSAVLVAPGDVETDAFFARRPGRAAGVRRRPPGQAAPGQRAGHAALPAARRRRRPGQDDLHYARNGLCAMAQSGAPDPRLLAWRRRFGSDGRRGKRRPPRAGTGGRDAGRERNPRDSGCFRSRPAVRSPPAHELRKPWFS